MLPCQTGCPSYREGCHKTCPQWRGVGGEQLAAPLSEGEPLSA